MELSKSFSRRDKTIQLIRQDSRPLTMMNRISCRSDDIDNLEEVIDMDHELERYQRHVKKNKTATGISHGNI